MSLKEWELETDEFFAERTIYILQQTVQKLSEAVYNGGNGDREEEEIRFSFCW